MFTRKLLACVAGFRKGSGRELRRETAREGGGKTLARPNSPFPFPFWRLPRRLANYILEVIEFLVQYHCLSSYQNDFVLKQLCIETSERWNVKPSTLILYWLALTPRRKPYRIGIHMMIIAEVNENERELKTTEKDLNNQQWGLGFSAPASQPGFQCMWATCFSSFFRSQQITN